jgi:hypothetical protein
MSAVATRPALSVKRLTAMVDDLGELNARISVLAKQADALKKSLKLCGFDEVIGTSFRAVISTRTTARLDSELVRSILSPAEVDACTVESTSTSISLYDL